MPAEHRGESDPGAPTGARRDAPEGAGPSGGAEPDAGVGPPRDTVRRAGKGAGRRPRRAIFIAGAAVVALVVLLAAVGLYLYRSGRVDEWLAGRVKETLARYNIRAEIEGLETKIGPRTALLTGVTLYNAATGEKIARIERLTATVRVEDLWAPRLSRNVSLETLELHRPEVWVTFDERGRSNFDGLRWPPPGPDRRITFEHANAVINIRDGLIHLKDGRRDVAGELRNVRGVVRPGGPHASAEGAMSFAELALSNSTLVYDGETLNDIALALEGRFDGRRAFIDALTLRSPVAEVKAEGAVNDLSEPAYELRLNSTLNLSQISNVFLDDVALLGTGLFSGTVKGRGAQYHVEGRFESESLAAEGLRVEGLNVNATADGEGSSYEAKLQVVAGSLSTGDARLKDVRLAGSVNGTGSDFRWAGGATAAAARSGQMSVASLTLDKAVLEVRGNVITGSAVRAAADRLTGEGLRVDDPAAVGLKFISEGQTQTFTAKRAAAGLVAAGDARLDDVTATGLTAVVRDELTRVDVRGVRVGGLRAGGARARGVRVSGVNISLGGETAEGQAGGVEVGAVALAGGQLKGVRLQDPTFSFGPRGGYRAGAGLRVSGGAFGEVNVGEARGELVATNGRLRLRNFNAQALGGTVTGDLLLNTEGGRSQLAAQFRGVDVGRLVSEVSERGVPLEGLASGEVNLTFPGTNFQGASGTVGAQVRGRAGAEGEEGLPVTGDLLVRAERGDFQIERADLRAGATELKASGRVSPAGETNLKVEVAAERAQELRKLLKALNVAPGLEEQIDRYGVSIAGGLNFKGTVRGSLAAPTVEGRVSVEELSAGGEPLGALSADIAVTPAEIRVGGGRLAEREGGVVEFAAALPRVGGRTGELHANVERYGAENLLAALPGLGGQLRERLGEVNAEVSGRVDVTGLPDEMRGAAELSAGPGRIGGQEFEGATARATFDGSRIRLEELTARLPAGRVAAQGQYDTETGLFDMRARGENVRLDMLGSLAGGNRLPPLSGTGDFTANVAGVLTEPETYQVQLEGVGRDVTVAGRPAGRVSLRGRTEDGKLNLELTTGLLGQPQTVTARIDLKNERLPVVVGADLRGADLTPLFAALLPAGADVRVSGRATGAVRLEGNLIDEEGAFTTGDLRGTATFADLRVGVEGVQLAAASPVTVRFGANEVFFEPTRFTGQGTNVRFGGAVALNEGGGQNLTADGQINLRVFNGLSPDLFLSGLADLNLRLTGTYAEPDLAGGLTLRGANVSALVGDERMTVSNIEGRVNFTSGRAEIASLTGRLGGGTLSFTGGARLTGLEPARFQLQLKGDNVTLPFPNDFMTTADLNLELEGSAQAQEVTGTVELERVSYTEPIELSDLLEGAREQSLEAGGGGGGAFGATTRLDVRVVGRDALTVRNNLAEIYGGSVFLQVGGTLAEPSVSGRVTARRGTVNFRGDQRYELQRAVVELPAADGADPLLDIQAAAEIKGYRVTVTLTGPLSEPRLLLRSDPPLPVGDVVSLITTGDLSSGVTTASTLAQSSLGTAASLLTDTFVNPTLRHATGELFGLNRFEIDPVVSGLGGTRPTLRVSAGRQFDRNLSVIYATNVTGEPNQTVTVEYKLSGHLLFVAQYEQGAAENLTSPGDNFTFEVRYRKRFSFASLFGGSAGAAVPKPEVDAPREGAGARPESGAGVVPPEAAKPKVEVRVSGYELSESEERELLPPAREQTAELSAVVEGARRLRNRLQEKGFFFAEVTPRCLVAGPPPATAAGGEAGSCERLIPEDLGGRTVDITYVAEPGRRFDLTDVRIEGTDKLTYEELESELHTREDSPFSFLPFFGDKRGYTSDQALERDRRTIIARMRELGYRHADVGVRRGVAVDAEDLIITFAVEEGPLTRVAGYEVRGNTLYTTERLREVAGGLVGGPFSRAAARDAAARLLAFYRENGYLEVDVGYDVVELPRGRGDEHVRLVYTVEEGGKVYVGRVHINGNVITGRDAILSAIPVSPGEVLRADELAESERLLYATDAFRQVVIRTEPAGRTPEGFERRDVVIDIEELKPYLAELGFGYSTDRGFQGSLSVRTDNLFGRLQQGAARARLSPNLQLLRLEYFKPRFWRYGDGRFAPLAVSAQYQRDTSVTTFFRSVIDRGGSGIVQRFDEEGRPVNEFGRQVGTPSVNRFLFNVETQRDFDREVGPRGRVLRRSTLYLRYNYEDVRLFNTESLLLAPLLRPDRAVRLSRLGATFVRDTRESRLDASRGDLLSLDYSLALRQLGGDISYQKFLASYYRFYTFERLGGTVLAGNVTLGLAGVIDPLDRNGNGMIDQVDRTLPISERFFAGGANSLRGFGFEEAGPRVVIPGGMFRDRQGRPVTLAPFAVPVGGNALAVLNLEARVPLWGGLQVVPFYDGGNVFSGFKDIFGSPGAPGADPNLNARWTNTAGLGLRLKTPVGPLGVDFGYLLNPPAFFIPQPAGPPSVFRPKPVQVHIRFGQAF